MREQHQSEGVNVGSHKTAAVIDINELYRHRNQNDSGTQVNHDEQKAETTAVCTASLLLSLSLQLPDNNTQKTERLPLRVSS